MLHRLSLLPRRVPSKRAEDRHRGAGDDGADDRPPCRVENRDHSARLEIAEHLKVGGLQ